MGSERDDLSDGDPAALPLPRLQREIGFAPALVAVSGGPDSTALLHLLAGSALRPRIRVAHVNHGWRGAESAGDEAFVRQLAASLALPFHALRLAPPSRRSGLESRARRERYAALAAVARSIGTVHVVLGHQRDDLVETLLMRVLRGAGLFGLRGILPRAELLTDQGPLTLHRPLLGVGRAALIRWLRERGHDFRTDSSNTDRSHLRNRVRHDYLPKLRTEWDADIDSRLLELASLATDLVAYCTARTAATRSRLPPLWRGASFDLSGLRQLPPAVALAGIRASLEELPLAPHGAALRALGRWLREGRSEQRGPLALRGGVEALIERARLLVGRACHEEALERPLVLPLPGAIQLPAWGGYLRAELLPGPHSLVAGLTRARADRWAAVVDLESLESPLVVRRRRAGDRFRGLGAPGERKLKKVLADRRLPQRLRDEWPLICSRDEIIWIPGVAIAQRVAVGPHTRRGVQILFDLGGTEGGQELVPERTNG
ncbi:MAG: tRNA lysidine(34) synthetase TilS [Planctomycetota bacterium]